MYTAWCDLSTKKEPTEACHMRGRPVWGACLHSRRQPSEVMSRFPSESRNVTGDFSTSCPSIPNHFKKPASATAVSPVEAADSHVADVVVDESSVPRALVVRLLHRVGDQLLFHRYIPQISITKPSRVTQVM